MSGAALLVVGGVITLTVSAIGIIGACGLWRPILIIVGNIDMFTHIASCVHKTLLYSSETRAVLTMRLSMYQWNALLPSVQAIVGDRGGFGQ